jgi:hypothetical protein
MAVLPRAACQASYSDCSERPRLETLWLLLGCTSANETDSFGVTSTFASTAPCHLHQYTAMLVCWFGAEQTAGIGLRRRMCFQGRIKGVHCPVEFRVRTRKNVTLVRHSSRSKGICEYCHRMSGLLGKGVAFEARLCMLRSPWTLTILYETDVLFVCAAYR